MKFVDIICIFFYIHSPYFMCHRTEYRLNYQRSKLGYRRKTNSTLRHQQFITATAKISDCVLKQGSETHSSPRQSNLQLQNQAARRYRHIREVEHWRYAAGLAGAHHSLQDRILLNYTRIENSDKSRKKLFVFVMYRSSQARNQRVRRNFAPTGKLCWTYFETIGHSLKNLSPSLKTLRPPGMVSQAGYGPGGPGNV